MFPPRFMPLTAAFRYPLLGAPQAGVVASVNFQLGGTHNLHRHLEINRPSLPLVYKKETIVAFTSAKRQAGLERAPKRSAAWQATPRPAGRACKEGRRRNAAGRPN